MLFTNTSMKNKILIGVGILVVVVLLSGCISQPPATTPPPAGEKEISFETVMNGKDGYSGYTEKANLVINDEETFFKIWRNYTSVFSCPTCGAFPFPKVNFSNETVIAVFMGEKNTGGYSIEITKIIDNGNNVIVYVNETSPKPDDIVTLALTQPYHIVKIKKILGLVEFQKIE